MENNYIPTAGDIFEWCEELYCCIEGDSKFGVVHQLGTDYQHRGFNFTYDGEQPKFIRKATEVELIEFGVVLDGKLNEFVLSALKCYNWKITNSTPTEISATKEMEGKRPYSIKFELGFAIKTTLLFNDTSQILFEKDLYETIVISKILKQLDDLFESVVNDKLN